MNSAVRPSFEVVLKEKGTYKSREQCMELTGKGNAEAWIAQTLSKRAIRLTLDAIQVLNNALKL